MPSGAGGGEVNVGTRQRPAIRLPPAISRRRSGTILPAESGRRAIAQLRPAGVSRPHRGGSRRPRPFPADAEAHKRAPNHRAFQRCAPYVRVPGQTTGMTSISSSTPPRAWAIGFANEMAGHQRQTGKLW
jgi:hypothetical protein